MVRREMTLKLFQCSDAPMPWLVGAPTPRRTDGPTRPLVGWLYNQRCNSQSSRGEACCCEHSERSRLS